MTHNAETRRFSPGGSQEVLFAAGGGTTTTVPPVARAVIVITRGHGCSVYRVQARRGRAAA